jgi:adenylate cyclase
MASDPSLRNVERKLAAILAADVVGSSRLMELDEEITIRRLSSCRAIVGRLVEDHHGRIFGGAGDSVVAEFGSPVEAVRCAIDMQQELGRQNAGVPTDRQMLFRVGVNLGDVIIDDQNLLGDGVNVAARLEGLADAGGLAVSESIYEQIRGKIEIPFEDAGDHHVKNIARPIRVWRWTPGQQTAATATRRRGDTPSVAVLPFVNMSGDAEQEYFSDGIIEDIITDLSRISGLFVPARHSSFVYKGSPVILERIREELGVRHVLEGSVRKAGNRVRITAQLVDTTTGGHLWAERYDRELTDVFAVQDDITHKIVESLRITLLPREKEAIEKVPTESFEAYKFYLLGRQFFRRHSRANYHVARRMFQKAIDLDSNYAPAYAGVADCESFLYLNYYLTAGIESILEVSAKALELDEDLAEAHASRGLALSTVERHTEAEVEFKKAIALDPNLFEAYYFYARACFAQGRKPEAAELFRTASEIRPDDFESPTFLMALYRDLGRPEESRAAGKEGFERAEAELRLRPENVRAAYLRAGYLAYTGERSRALEWVSRALSMEPDDFLTQYNAACTYAQLGEIEQALDLLERSLPNAHNEIHAWVQQDSDLDPLRSHPRFQALFNETGTGSSGNE